VTLRGKIVERISDDLYKFQDASGVVNVDIESCALWRGRYGVILRICFTSISTEFQSLSTSP
jgi:hypothetical protein